FRIQSWNQAAERIYGWNADEVIGKTTHEILKTRFESEEEQQWVTERFRQDGFWNGEITQYHKDGSERAILGAITLLKDSSAKPFGVVSVNHDISNRKEAAKKALEL